LNNAFLAPLEGSLCVAAHEASISEHDSLMKRWWSVNKMSSARKTRGLC
jgi:hypothetical protein